MKRNEKIKVELSVLVQNFTERAVLVNDGSSKEDQWLPRSQIETDDPIMIGSVIRVEIPEWLAKEKKFIY